MLFFLTPSYAKVYKWVDQTGTIHFTDNPSSIPLGSHILLEEFAIPQTSSPTDEEEPKEEKTPPEEEKTQNKSEKENLQTQLADIQTEIKRNKARAQALETELKRPKYKQLVRQERSLKKELGETKKELDRLEKEQAEIEKKLKAKQ